VILWDGSADAEAALCAAVPLLKLASQVTVLQVDEVKSISPLCDAVNYLEIKSIAARRSRRDAMGEHPTQVIERYLRRHQAAWAIESRVCRDDRDFRVRLNGSNLFHLAGGWVQRG